MKEYGKDLKKKFNNLNTELDIVSNKIKKRLYLIVADHYSYMDYSDLEFCSRYDLKTIDLNKMLEIIMRTEENYVKATSKQLELF